MERKNEIIRVLPGRIRSALEHFKEDFNKIMEIRLRVNGPVLILYHSEEYFLRESGEMARDPRQALITTWQDVQESMEYISSFSMYAFDEEMRQGFITIQGGHRVGIAGKTVVESSRVQNIRNVSFINIRLSHEVKGCADALMSKLICRGEISQTLIISPPGCGKTTLLRDIIRQISNGGNGWCGVTVGVVDERSELAACYMGVPQNDLGIRSDVLDCCPKAEGMLMMLRSMAPRVIAVDEIGSKEDIEALEYVMNCGCILLATVHGKSIEDIRQKPLLGQLVNRRLFSRYVVLSKEKEVGHVENVFDDRGTVLL